jgi:hypothetical protein
VAELERQLKERSAALLDHKDQVAAAKQERDDASAERAEVAAKLRRALDEKQVGQMEKARSSCAHRPSESSAAQ